MGMLGLLVDAWRRGHAPEFLSQGTDVSAGVTYAGFALSDPKAPIELKVMGPMVWAGQVTAVTSALYLIDPLRLREGGLDDVWYSGVHNMYSWPGDVWVEATSWIPRDAPWWLGAIDE